MDSDDSSVVWIPIRSSTATTISEMYTVEGAGDDKAAQAINDALEDLIRSRRKQVLLSRESNLEAASTWHWANTGHSQPDQR